jgi:hypothetical protein
MTDVLDQIKNLGLPLTWATIRAGWEGIGHLGRQLTAADVAAFACQEIANASAEILLDVADLCTGSDSESITEALARLAPDIRDRDRRTWRAVELIHLLEELPESPIDGLAELTDFWGALEFPDDMPHVVQGLGNDISPLDYYTEKTYRQLLDRHRTWLRSEIAAIADER